MPYRSMEQSLQGDPHMTQREEVGTVIVVLLLVIAVAAFAYCMGTFMGQQLTLSQPCAALCQVSESIRP